MSYAYVIWTAFLLRNTFNQGFSNSIQLVSKEIRADKKLPPKITRVSWSCSENKFELNWVRNRTFLFSISRFTNPNVKLVGYISVTVRQRCFLSEIKDSKRSKEIDQTDKTDLYIFAILKIYLDIFDFMLSEAVLFQRFLGGSSDRAARHCAFPRSILQVGFRNVCLKFATCFLLQNKNILIRS